MKPLHHVGSVVVAVLAFAAVVLAGPEVSRHSGTVVAVDPRAGTLELAEVGPWKLVDGETAVTGRTIALTERTTFVLVRRIAQAPSGYAGDFEETTIGATGLAAGQHVTVECERSGARMVARRVAVTGR